MMSIPVSENLLNHIDTQVEGKYLHETRIKRKSLITNKRLLLRET